jgi:DNA-binding transcriptional regulator PaaX
MKRRFKRGEVVSVILRTIGAVGIIGVAVLAPNALQILKIGRGKKFYYYKGYINRKIVDLKDMGFIEIKHTKNGNFLLLTAKGERELERHKLNLENKKINKKWDKKWRVVMFDINEYKRRERNNLRRQLIEAGFQKLQNSVWITPNECEDFIVLLKTDLKLGKGVVYLTADKIDNDRKLRKKFGLL